MKIDVRNGPENVPKNGTDDGLRTVLDQACEALLFHKS